MAPGSLKTEPRIGAESDTFRTPPELLMLRWSGLEKARNPPVAGDGGLMYTRTVRERQSHGL
jgi:hypothetical protein